MSEQDQKQGPEEETCQLCRKEKGQYHIGGPVRFVCKSCQRIVQRYFKFFNEQQAFLSRTRPALNELVTLHDRIKKSKDAWESAPIQTESSQAIIGIESVILGILEEKIAELRPGKL